MEDVGSILANHVNLSFPFIELISVPIFGIMPLAGSLKKRQTFFLEINRF